jgi:hypothetical protein
MYRFVARFGVIAMVLVCVTQSGEASEAQAMKHYGAGVHALFQGRYETAIQQLDFASGYASDDARIYYLRGIAKLRSGRQVEAEFDFEVAAQMEATHPRQDVGRSLERFQGHERLVIERHRRQARRMAALIAPPPGAEPNRSPTDSPNAARLEPARAEPPSPKPLQPRREQVAPAVRPTRNPIRLSGLAADPSDPFLESAGGFLGRGPFQRSAELPTETELATDAPSKADESESPASIDTNGSPDPFAEDQPVGSGIVERNPDDLDLDAGNDAPAASASSSSPQNPPASTRSGVFGAALRAITRGILPAEPLAKQGEQWMRASGIRSNSSPIPPAETPSAPAETADPFAAEPTADDSGQNPTPSGTPAPAATEESSDPFGGDPFTDDPPGEASMEDAEQAAPPTDEASDDPFGA